MILAPSPEYRRHYCLENTLNFPGQPGFISRLIAVMDIDNPALCVQQQVNGQTPLHIHIAAGAHITFAEPVSVSDHGKSELVLFNEFTGIFHIGRKQLGFNGDNLKAFMLVLFIDGIQGR